MTFRTILVANRGEIACRVIKTARRLGYRTVAVFSDADVQAPHVRQADMAVHIGGAAAVDSYLNIAALLHAAEQTGADAVHPGYGFLSERPDFVDACDAAGLVFIGPPAAAMRAMGDKAQAKRRMLAAGVPCAPGYLGDDQGDERLAAEAQALGLPLLVKAVAGGGGRGMRLVRHWAELADALAGARRETQSAFGDGRLMLERLIDNGRHIEIQVFADNHGNAIHLGERDCSAQRRRQKLIEESPAPGVSVARRAAMGSDAIAAALAVGYRGAGTVEFIVDDQGSHHFLEMNTRLQVEHPVTECVTGLDLVEWQLRVAAGEPLPLTQDQVRFEGHAIEARLCAEDPYAGWQPQAGPIAGWQPADASIRIDHGIETGGSVPPWYDGMVAKFISHGRDRSEAIRRLVQALEDTPLLGLPNNGRFLRDLLLHPDFVAARLTTASVDGWAAGATAILQRPQAPELAWRVAAAVLGGSGRPFDLRLGCQGVQRRLPVPVAGVGVLPAQDGWLPVVVDGVRRHLRCARDAATLHLAVDGACFSFSEPSPYPARADASDPRRARAPVAGVLAQLRVAVGDRVEAGQPLACIEAMKMEMWLHAAAAGTVSAVRAAVRDSVAAGAVVIELELSDA